MIKTASLASEIWDYVNPKTPKDQLPTLVEPPKPTPEMVHQPQASGESQLQDAPIGTIDLTDCEFKHYKMLQYKWTAEKKEYQKKKEALINL